MRINKIHSFGQIGKTSESIKPDSDKNTQITDMVEFGGREEIPVNTHKKWLFMNYISADCNLKSGMLGIVDNQEFVGSDEHTHIVALVDVGPEANPMDGTWSGARSFYVTRDEESNKIKSPVINEYGDHLDMSSSTVLKNFIVDTMKKFPADNVAIVLSDHGGGFTGAMEDSSDGDFMSVPHLKQALEEAEKETGKKLNILGFNACLMADAEAAYEFRNNADILLASEESEYNPGWNFQSILGKNMDKSIKKLQDAISTKINVTPEEFAKLVVQANSENQTKVPTFSATDLSKMEDLAKATDNLAKAILKTEEKKAVRNSIMVSEHYGGYWSPYCDMRDLHHIAKTLEKEVNDPDIKKASKELMKTFDETIIANESDPEYYSNSKGLHIYAPLEGEKSMGFENGTYGELAFARDTHWDEAMKSLGTGEVTPGVESFSPSVWPDGSPKGKQ